MNTFITQKNLLHSQAMKIYVIEFSETDKTIFVHQQENLKIQFCRAVSIDHKKSTGLKENFDK